MSVPPPPMDYYENGRLYHGFRKGKYMYPCDEVFFNPGIAVPTRAVARDLKLTILGDQNEKDRMDIFHKFFLVARRDQLHSTPFIPNYDRGPRILDLGTGTGIWAIDMAE